MRCFAFISVLCFGVGLSEADERYPTAGQHGPSCAFFANVPALTYTSGVDIGPSTDFIIPIYQLHRGDAKFARGFSKEKFFEFFAIPYQSHVIRHDDLSAKTLEVSLQKLIEEKFDKGLAEGRLYSLRVIGIFGGPHNALLMGKEDGLYVVHDPLGSKLKRMNRDELAEWILVPTSATRHSDKKRYLTDYLEITLQDRHKAPWKGLGKLPSKLNVEFSEDERKVLREAFRGDGETGDDLDARILRYPKIDFAALPPEGNNKKHENAVNDELKAEELTGVLQLSKFFLCKWHLKLRNRLPVLFLQGRPCTLVSYRPREGDDENEATLLFDDGSKTLALSPKQALAEFKKSGSHFGTVVIPIRK